MGSFRRTMSLMQRDAAEKNGEDLLDSSPSPKPSHPSNLLSFGRLLATLSTSLDSLIALDRIQAAAPGIFLQRTRHLERSKLRGQHWSNAFFRFFVCFMVGIFVGFTPFMSVDFSKNSTSKHQAFSFELDPVAENAQMYIDRPKSRALSIDESASKDNTGFRSVSNLAVKNLSPNNFYSHSLFHDPGLIYRKPLLIVTPTYARPFQAYYLNRLAHTLRIVRPPFLWIVVEMSLQSTETASILRETGVMYQHLLCDKNVSDIKDRGAHQRNVALSHIEKHQLDGIVYFTDDDNVYSVDLFEQMREIRRFGTWPVAMLTENTKQVLVEGAVCNGSQVIGWHTYERNMMSRRFHAVMSGFAFNSTILWDPKRWHRPTVNSIRQLDTAKKGFQATMFIEQLVEDESQMECLPKDGTMVMVWHLNVEAPGLFYPQGWSVQKNLEVVAPLT